MVETAVQHMTMSYCKRRPICNNTTRAVYGSTDDSHELERKKKHYSMHPSVAVVVVVVVEIISCMRYRRRHDQTSTTITSAAVR